MSRSLRALGSLVLVFVAAYALYALAARNYAPSRTDPTTGASASAITEWNILAPGQEPPLVASLDLARQAGTTPLGLAAVAAAKSAILLVIASGIALGCGVPLGFWIALSGPRTLAATLRAATSVGVTFPAFFLVFVLQLFAVGLAGVVHRTVLPVYGYGLDAHVVLPALALAAAPMAYATRLVALAAEELERRDFVRTARAKGMTERIVIYRHIAANMIGPLGESALGAVRLALAGLVIVEYLLVWPGLGVLILRAANVQDAGVFVTGVGLLGTAFLAVELALDAVTHRRSSAAA